MFSRAVLTTVSNPAVYAAFAAVVAFAWAFVLATAVTRRVNPAVPATVWWRPSVVSALLTAAVALTVHNPTAGIIAAIIVPALALSSYVDALTSRIPNLYSGYTAIIIACMAAGISIGVHPAEGILAAIAGAAIFTGFLLLNIVSRGGFGMGDVKFSAVIGAALTLIDAVLLPANLLHTSLGIIVLVLHLLAWTTLSFLPAGIYGTVRIVRGNKAAFPFGPFLAAGWLVAAAATPAFVGLVTPFA